MNRYRWVHQPHHCSASVCCPYSARPKHVRTHTNVHHSARTGIVDRNARPKTTLLVVCVVCGFKSGLLELRCARSMKYPHSRSRMERYSTPGHGQNDVYWNWTFWHIHTRIYPFGTPACAPVDKRMKSKIRRLIFTAAAAARSPPNAVHRVRIFEMLLWGKVGENYRPPGVEGFSGSRFWVCLYAKKSCPETTLPLLCHKRLLQQYAGRLVCCIGWCAWLCYRGSE